MAKLYGGYMGGFSGKLGPAVGYMWNGRWCVRSHNPFPRNPRTEKQVEHRDAFRAAVQLAASMRWAVTTTMTAAAREWGMTSYNVFVHLNHRSVSVGGGALRVDWGALRLSPGEMPGMVFGRPVRTADNVLTVGFERGAYRPYDSVYLYAYCPDTGRGFLCAPVYCKARRVSVMLPDGMAGSAVHVYGFVQNVRGVWGETAYVGCVPAEAAAEDAEPALSASAADAVSVSGVRRGGAAAGRGADAEGAAGAAGGAPPALAARAAPSGRSRP